MQKEKIKYESYDHIRTNHHDRDLRSRHHADTLSAVSRLFFKETDAKVYCSKKPTPKYIVYLGKALPCAVFGMLVVYCLKNVSLLSGTHGIPELIAIGITAGLHLWKKQMLLSIAGGTIAYMLLVQLVFK